MFPHPLADLSTIAPRPVFFITGDRDVTVPPQSSAELYRGDSGPKELWVVHRAEHGNYAQVAGEEYSRRLVSFFDRALLGRAASDGVGSVRGDEMVASDRSAKP